MLEIIIHYTQDDFVTPESEEEIYLLKSESRYSSLREFAKGITDYAWGEKTIELIPHSSVVEFLSEVTAELKSKLPVDLSSKENIEFLMVCNDWNSKAVAWEENNIYYALCWCTYA